MKHVFAILFILFISGCGSMIRERCESEFPFDPQAQNQCVLMRRHALSHMGDGLIKSSQENPSCYGYESGSSVYLNCQ